MDITPKLTMTIEAVVIRNDGTKEDLGTIVEAEVEEPKA